ncbi:MAG: hypothetical protein U1C73_13975 [Dietzia sp.]|nr:hypothetical protein [Dietzia sp.]
MTWFKVDDGFWSHPKVMCLSDAAIALWVRAGTYSCQHLTDGHVPAAALRLLGDRDAASELVDAGLWMDATGGFLFHDWDEYQETSEDVKRRREANRERKRKQRRNATGQFAESPQDTPGSHADVTRDTPRDSRDRHSTVTPEVTPSRPDPTRPDPTSPNGELAHAGAHAHERPREPRSNGRAVPTDGWKLVRDLIPDTHPQAVRSALAIQAGTLLHAGTPDTDIRDALTLWLDKPHAGPGLLPSLVSEAVKTRDRPPPTTASKSRRFADIGRNAAAALAQAQAQQGDPHDPPALTQ